MNYCNHSSPLIASPFLSCYIRFRWPINASDAIFNDAANKNNIIGSGPNVLSIRVDPRADEGWWYEGGGIYRPVSIVAIRPLTLPRPNHTLLTAPYIVPDGVFVAADVLGTIDRSGFYPTLPT